MIVDFYWLAKLININQFLLILIDNLDFDWLVSSGLIKLTWLEWTNLSYWYRGLLKTINNIDAFTVAVSLACLEIISRNEEAINFTRNRIYSLKVFTSYFIDVEYSTGYILFCLFLNWFSTRVSDDRKYVYGRRLYACINTQKFKGMVAHYYQRKTN